MHAFLRYGAHQPATAASADGRRGSVLGLGDKRWLERNTWCWLAAAPEACVYILFSGPGAIIKLPDHT